MNRAEMIEWCIENQVDFVRGEPVCLPDQWEWEHSTYPNRTIENTYEKFGARPEKITYENVYGKEPEAPIDKGEKYQVAIRNRRTGETIMVDTYDMIVALGITCPAMAHAFKKVANAGKRGHKNYDTDCNEAINSIEQSKLLRKWVK